MRWETICKPTVWTTQPNLLDYDAARAAFTWDAARHELDGLRSGGINIAHESVTRHAHGQEAEKIALIWLAKDGRRREVTYAQLEEQTNRFARALQALGVRAGDRVFTLLGRVPELHVAVLGALKIGAVVSPLFSAFGPEPIRQRMHLGDARVLVTSRPLYRRKVAAVRAQLPHLAHVLFVDGADADVSGSYDLAALLEAASPEFAIPPTKPDQLALLHFTSGTTGTPKGAMHVHEAVVAHHATARLALDLRADDVFWCTADPGWVTGTSYGIIAPLTIGATLVVDEAEFDASRWYETLARERVNVWYTAPTAVRMMMRATTISARDHDLSALRFVSSVGEPLNPEAVLWGVEALGLAIHDNWWQTETGGVMIANFAACEIRPGSMGRPLPGIDATILRRDNEGNVVVRDGRAVEADVGEEGELALRPGWPSMFRGYLDEEERYRRCFAGGWYLSGDLATRDADGWYWFVGRGDDVIKSAGHLIGPFEVESALMEHPAVAEAGVIGKPDAVVGAVVKAFVVLRAGFEPTDALRLELIGFGRKRLGAAVAPKEIEFRAELPKTRSGKIMRRLLRARELGLPEGDLSTLESDT
ncbi:MAG TPA: acetate--CoA ligase [Acidimicrobiia bacterium]|nr:acetate--CoA ligase [Acidimicrobiia bacterium]